MGLKLNNNSKKQDQIKVKIVLNLLVLIDVNWFQLVIRLSWQRPKVFGLKINNEPWLLKLINYLNYQNNLKVIDEANTGPDMSIYKKPIVWL